MPQHFKADSVKKKVALPSLFFSPVGYDATKRLCPPSSASQQQQKKEGTPDPFTHTSRDLPPSRKLHLLFLGLGEHLDVLSGCCISLEGKSFQQCQSEEDFFPLPL